MQRKARQKPCRAANKRGDYELTPLRVLILRKSTCDFGSYDTCYCGCVSVSCHLSSDSYYDYCEDKLPLEIR